ncbi:aminodeoxychorismate/anthranilate synthase component II [Utexia brackfieldae]|uniref:anthranilate synthase component II n=1 Tax=Utexia brackfieldae TaxID=3074108 RepID=UPI00370D1D06
MLLLIDNHDSFTYNLADYFRQLGVVVHIIKNDALTLTEIIRLQPSAIVISPGPGNPDQAGMTLAVIDYFAGKVPMLGICLGHQAIAQYFGAKVIPATTPVHGKIAAISHDNQTLFAGQPNPLNVVRYHSLIVDNQTVPACLQISALTDDQIIMALRHKTLPIESLQFHPEAILTENGLALLKQFLIFYSLLSNK